MIGQGESWETSLLRRRFRGVDGPTVMVVGGLHGDEPAVVLAGDRLVQAAKEITSGKVILVPEANAAAIKAKKRLVGTDLNRAFPRGEDDHRVASGRGDLADRRGAPPRLADGSPRRKLRRHRADRGLP